MDNATFLNQMKYTYESLKYFSIKDNYLLLNNEKIYMIPFTNVTLSTLNQNLFLLDPNEIFHILYMLELLPKQEINDNEIAFINQYVQRYLKLNDEALTNSNMDTNLIYGLSIPIYLSYEPNYINNPVAMTIQNNINTHSEELESGKGKHPRLVRTNPNIESIMEEDSITSFEKAGFTTLLLIASAVASTCLYLAYFIIGK